MCASVNVMVLAVIFRSVVHFELIFVDSVSQGSHFILLHSGVQLSKYRSHHLGLINYAEKMKVCPFPPPSPRRGFLQLMRRDCRTALCWCQQGPGPGTRKPGWKPQSEER